MYFYISTSEDGNRIKIIENIDEFLNLCCEENFRILDQFPLDRWSNKRDCIDNECFLDDDEVILIKGEIIVPKIVEKVTKYEI